MYGSCDQLFCKTSNQSGQHTAVSTCCKLSHVSGWDCVCLVAQKAKGDPVATYVVEIRISAHDYPSSVET